MDSNRHRVKVKVRIKKEKPAKKFLVRFYRNHRELSYLLLVLVLIFTYLVYYIVRTELNPVVKETKVVLAGEDDIKLSGQ